MRTLIISVLLLFPSLASATPITFSFEGRSQPDDWRPSGYAVDLVGEMTVNMAHELGEVHNLTGSMGYQVLSWEMVGTSTHPALPSFVFSSRIAGQTAEYCEGTCLFLSGDIRTLRFVDTLGDVGTYVQLVFTPAFAFNGSASLYKVGGNWMYLTSGTLTQQAVPEPSSLWPMVGLLSLLTLCTGRKGAYGSTR